jgi:hypothetical protein
MTFCAVRYVISPTSFYFLSQVQISAPPRTQAIPTCFFSSPVLNIVNFKTGTSLCQKHLQRDLQLAVIRASFSVDAEYIVACLVRHPYR